MSQFETPFPYEEQGNVTIWDLSDWSGDPEETAGAEDDWLRVVNQPHITASILRFSDELTLGTETQEYISDSWSKLADTAEIEKNAYVSDGLAAMAIEANVDADTEIETFDTVDDAFEWARE